MNLFDVVVAENFMDTNSSSSSSSSSIAILTNEFQGRPSSEVNEFLVLHYIAELLATLPYSSSEEPLLIIYHATKILSLRGTNLIKSLKPLLGGKQDEDDEEDIGNADQTINQEVKRKWFQKQLQSAQILCLLVRLKLYLKKVYNLTDSKVQAFVPSSVVSVSISSKNASDKQVGTVLACLPSFCAFPESLVQVDISDDLFESNGFRLTQESGLSEEDEDMVIIISDPIKKSVLPLFLELENLLSDDPVDIAVFVGNVNNRQNGNDASMEMQPKDSKRRASKGTASAKSRYKKQSRKKTNKKSRKRRYDSDSSGDSDDEYHEDSESDGYSG